MFVGFDDTHLHTRVYVKESALTVVSMCERVLFGYIQVCSYCIWCFMFFHVLQ